MISSFRAKPPGSKRIGMSVRNPTFPDPFFWRETATWKAGKVVNLKVEKSGALTGLVRGQDTVSRLLYKQHDLKMVPASFWPILFVSGDFDTRTSWKWEELPQSAVVRYLPELILAYLLENLAKRSTIHTWPTWLQNFCTNPWWTRNALTKGKMTIPMHGLKWSWMSWFAPVQSLSCHEGLYINSVNGVAIFRSKVHELQLVWK